jgi:mono/diheme cytochrome c family protein
LYLDGHAGGFSKDVYAPFGSLAQVAAAQPKDESAKFLAQGQDVFDKTCTLCHQPNGSGKEGLYPPLAGSDWVLAPGPNRIARIVFDGVTGPITISGKLFNVGAQMPPWRDVYKDDAQVAAVLSYIRKQWGNNAPPIKPADIKALRAATASHTGHAWTADELQQISP